MRDASGFQLDLFSVLPNATFVADLADVDAGPYPCERCGRESDDLDSPRGDPCVLWCRACRGVAELCCSCGDEIEAGAFDCAGCRAYAIDTIDHFGDDR